MDRHVGNFWIRGILNLMCGRAYHLARDEELLERYVAQYSNIGNPKGIKPNYNFCPTQLAAVVFVQGDERLLGMFRWGLIPKWAKSIDDASKYSLINARSEEVLEKRSYKDAFLKRRCIIPMSGFYEWRRVGRSKTPFAIHARDHSILSIGGIWEKWGDGDEAVYSFSMLTKSANQVMAPIHDRMPVFIDAQDEADFLNPNTAPEVIYKIMDRPHESLLGLYEVSTAVNNPRNNRVELLDPVKAK